MSDRLKLGYRVRVLDGIHKGKEGTVSSKSGGVVIVRLVSGGKVQIAASSLQKVEVKA